MNLRGGDMTIFYFYFFAQMRRFLLTLDKIGILCLVYSNF